MMRAFRTFLTVAIVVGIVVLATNSVFAQCSMCRAAIENSANSAEASKGLNLAALGLLIPPVSIFAGLFGVIYRFRNVQGRKER